MTDAGGDPACWADRVCPACDMLDERTAAVRDDACPHCGDRQEDHLPTPHSAAPTTTPVEPGTADPGSAPGSFVGP